MEYLDKNINDQIIKNLHEQKEWNKSYLWIDDGESWSESFGGTEELWNAFIYPRIYKYLRDNVLEIASGHGRISKKLINYASRLYLVDMNKNCIERCKEVLELKENIFYFVNDGLSLNDIEDNSIDFVFSWDSFVHMQKFVIENYLKEINKKLKIGGYGAIHHSYLFGGDDEYSFKNIQGRSNFSPELFKVMCEEHRLEIINQEIFKFNALFDVISIFRRIF